jgi:hypothetical protein
MSRHNQKHYGNALHDGASNSSVSQQLQWQQRQKKRQRQRRTVLTEEEYSAKLSAIIQRDYYPDLVELERQTAVNQRREEGDLAGALAVRRAARQLQQHEESMVEQERLEEEEALVLTVPTETASEQQQALVEHDGVGGDGVGLRRTPRPLERESLTGFHARVTSEDNVAFEETQQKELEARRRERERANGNGSLLLGPTSKVTQSRSSIAAAASPFLLASDEFLPESNAPDYFHNNCHDDSCALMPPPSAVDRNQREEIRIPKDALVEYIPKATGLQKKIEPSATRFPRPNTVVRRPEDSHFEGSDDDGDSSSSTECDYSTDASTDLDATPIRPIGQEQRQGWKRKRREQETLVQMTPLIVPGQHGANESPLVTWGAVASTPVVLGQQSRQHDDNDVKVEPPRYVEIKVEPPRSSYSMPDQNPREQAAAVALGKLEERARKSRSAGTPILDRNNKVSSMTPAAKAFLAKSSNRNTGRPLSARSGSAFASALRSSYSRTPNSRSGRSASTTSSSVRQKKGRNIDRSSRAATPRMKSERKEAPTNIRALTNHPNVTDGLLQLPR